MQLSYLRKHKIMSKVPEEIGFGSTSDNRVKVNVTPYSIFVHASPVYKTSELVAKRSARPGSRPHGRPNRILPLRPDGYPYANRRWSGRLGMKISTSGEEAA